MRAKLSARFVETAKPGKYGDGGGLWLMVEPSRAKRWAFKFMLPGRAREMGLGSADALGLAAARDAATDARRLVAQGIDPIEAKKRSGTVPTFGEVAKDVIASLTTGFRNPKHRAQSK